MIYRTAAAESEGAKRRVDAEEIKQIQEHEEELFKTLTCCLNEIWMKISILREILNFLEELTFVQHKVDSEKFIKTGEAEQ